MHICTLMSPRLASISHLTRITAPQWKNPEEKPTWPRLKASNSSSRGIKSTPGPFSASPPSPFCRLTCLIDHAFSPHCGPVISTMYIFGTPILGAFDPRSEKEQSYGEEKMIEEDLVFFSFFSFFFFLSKVPV